MRARPSFDGGGGGGCNTATLDPMLQVAQGNFGKLLLTIGKYMHISQRMYIKYHQSREILSF